MKIIINICHKHITYYKHISAINSLKIFKSAFFVKSMWVSTSKKSHVEPTLACLLQDKTSNFLLAKFQVSIGLLHIIPSQQKKKQSKFSCHVLIGTSDVARQNFRHLSKGTNCKLPCEVLMMYSYGELSHNYV